MEKEKLNSFSVRCHKCGYTLPVKDGASSFRYGAEYKDKDGQSIWLTYFDCPSCGERHYVQIDDSMSTQYLKKAASMFNRYAAMRRRGMTVSQRQIAKLDSTKSRLSSIRLELMQKYSDKELYNVSDCKWESIKFSVC